MTCFTQVPQFVKTFGCKLILDRNLPNFLNKNILTGIYFYLIIYQTFLVKRKILSAIFIFCRRPSTSSLELQKKTSLQIQKL